MWDTATPLMLAKLHRERVGLLIIGGGGVGGINDNDWGGRLARIWLDGRAATTIRRSSRR